MSFSSRFRGGHLVAAIALCWISGARAGAEQKKPPVFGTDLALVQVPVFVSGKDHAAATV